MKSALGGTARRQEGGSNRKKPKDKSKRDPSPFEDRSLVVAFEDDEYGDPIEHRDYSPDFDFDAQQAFNNSKLEKTELVLNSAVTRLFEDAVRRKELKERTQLLSAKRELEELR